MAQFGSFINQSINDLGPGNPVVGAGATIYYWSDRYAYEVLEVNDRDVKIAPYAVTWEQPYTGYANPLKVLEENAVWIRFRYGKWWMRNAQDNAAGTKFSAINIRFGYKSHYQDPSF